MVKIIYVNEIIHYDKTKVCGWTYKEIKYRVDYKTKKTRFVTYLGYCQRDYERWSDNFTEAILIHSNYTHFPTDNKLRFKKKVRKGSLTWEGEVKYE